MNVRAAMLCLLATVLLLSFVVQVCAEVTIYWKYPYGNPWYSFWEPYKRWKTSALFYGLYGADDHLIVVLDTGTIIVMDWNLSEVASISPGITDPVGADYNADCNLLAVVDDVGNLLSIIVYYPDTVHRVSLSSIGGSSYALVHSSIAVVRESKIGACYVVEWAKDAYDNVVRYFIIDPINGSVVASGESPSFIRVKYSNYLLRVENNGIEKAFHVAVLEDTGFKDVYTFTVETVWNNISDTDPIALRAAVYDSENNAIYIAADQVSVNKAHYYIIGYQLGKDVLFAIETYSPVEDEPTPFVDIALTKDGVCATSRDHGTIMVIGRIEPKYVIHFTDFPSMNFALAYNGTHTLLYIYDVFESDIVAYVFNPEEIVSTRTQVVYQYEEETTTYTTTFTEVGLGYGDIALAGILGAVLGFAVVVLLRR